MHDWHVAHGARFVNAGLWKRPHSYPRGGESADDAASREAKNVRSNVGVVDVSTLGKIELQGADVAEFLNRVYINRWDTLAVGRCRYGVMLRDDGVVLDDGTTSRLAPTHEESQGNQDREERAAVLCRRIAGPQPLHLLCLAGQEGRLRADRRGLPRDR